MAQDVLAICDRFHKLPSEVLAESSYLDYLITLESFLQKAAPQRG